MQLAVAYNGAFGLKPKAGEVKLTDIDPFYVHIDPMVVMLAPKLAAVCRDSTDLEVVHWLKSKNIEIVSVLFQDTLALGCNVVALGNGRVLIPEKSAALKQKLRAHGIQIFAADVAMITPGGVH